MTVTHVVGFDLSLNQSGWAQWITERLITDGLITDICQPCRINQADPLFQTKRLKHILQWIKGMVGQANRTFVVMEGIPFGAKGITIDQIHGMHHLVRYWLLQSGIPFLIVNPTTLKKFVLGKGVGQKDLILKEMVVRFGLNLNTSDEADAAALVYIGSAFLGLWMPTNQPQRDVVKDLRSKNKHLLEDKW